MVNSVKPIVLMVVVQSIYAAVNILIKMVANAGMSLHVLVAYRFIFSAAFIVPFALVFERKYMQNLTWKVLFQASLCGLFGGSLIQNLYANALALLPTLYTTTMLNLVPATTYLMVICLRMEKPNLGTPGGKAKLLGTLVGIGGAMILSLYEGKKLFTWSTHIDLLKHVASPPQGAPTGHPRFFLGLMLSMATPLSYSSWLIVQAKMSEKFPWHYSIAALTSIMGAIQSIIFALCTERDWSRWKLEWNLMLLGAAFTGILGSGVCITLLAWCVRLKGALYVSAFSPLMLVLVAFAGSLVLNEYITVGSLTGATLIVIGLYMLLWGKSKETRMAESEMILVSEKDPVHCGSVPVANSSLA